MIEYRQISRDGKIYYGKHYMANMKCCINFDSTTMIKAIIEELVEKIGMEPLGPPHIHLVDNRDHYELSGITAVQIITTSHISIHTYIESGDIYFDLFSCKDYDHEMIDRFLIKKFMPAKIESNFIMRG